MGNTSSQTVKEYIESKTSYEVSVENTITVNSSSTVKQTGINQVTLTVGDPGDCCTYCTSQYDPQTGVCGGTIAQLNNCTGGSCGGDLNLTMTNIAESEVITSINTELASNITNNLKNAISADLSAKLTELDEGGVLDKIFPNKSVKDVEMEFSSEFDATMETVNEQDLYNSVLQTTITANNADITICGYIGGDCNINQLNSLQAQVKNILSAVGSLLQNNDVINDIYIKIAAEVSEETCGWTCQLAKFFTSIFGILVIGGVVLLIILAIVAVVIWKSGGKDVAMQFAGPPPVFTGAGGAIGGGVPAYPAPQPVYRAGGLA